MLNVQFADESGAEIIAYFGAAQDENEYKYLGVVDSGDERWIDYYNVRPNWVREMLPSPS